MKIHSFMWVAALFILSACVTVVQKPYTRTPEPQRNSPPIEQEQPQPAAPSKTPSIETLPYYGNLEKIILFANNRKKAYKDYLKGRNVNNLSRIGLYNKFKIYCSTLLEDNECLAFYNKISTDQQLNVAIEKLYNSDVEMIVTTDSFSHHSMFIANFTGTLFIPNLISLSEIRKFLVLN